MGECLWTDGVCREGGVFLAGSWVDQARFSGCFINCPMNMEEPKVCQY
jgi:hypothetical protein